MSAAESPAAPTDLLAAQDTVAQNVSAQDRAADPASAVAVPDVTPPLAADSAALEDLGLAGAEVSQPQTRIQTQDQTQDQTRPQPPALTQPQSQIPDPAENPIPEPSLDPGSQAPLARQAPQDTPQPDNGVAPQDPSMGETALPAQQGAAPLSPRVQTLPTSTPGISIRRGTDGDTDASAQTGALRPDALASQRPMPGVPVRRLPSVGTPDTPGPISAQGADSEAEQALEPNSARVIGENATETGLPPDGPAFRRNAAVFDPQPGLRPMAVILTESATARDAILDLMMPVTVAVNPLDPGAALRARAYRQAGHEVALLAVDVPVLSTASDLAVTVQSWLRDFPQALAIMDVRRDGIASSRTLARDMVQMMAPEGLAAIAQRGGPDNFRQMALEAGLPALSLYRNLDGRGQNPVALRRMIDRAAFEALRQDSIVITGSADNPEIMAALNSFAMGGGRDGVMLAPVSVFFPTE
jgi:hypothetical protein